ncbi:hypothetical protein PV11_09311 [Exophiala sideris]|uniref:Uncharacterized protein n=1 Tax=Exophiala sideris TaxID=1016849 RepID=A0A0D1WR43_9EURO|nr:hypothetical protein PV11_09311 [Exophiala sideris]
MAGMNPLPTHHIHSTTRLTHREAHTFLSSFLERAEIDAAYRPDSTLTETGPQAVSTGSNPNLTLHHLRRILTGIEGKKVGGDLAQSLGYGDGEDAGGDTNRIPRSKRPFDSQEETPRKSKRSTYEVVDSRAGPADDDAAPAMGVTAGDDDWQDKDTYALAQEEGGLDLLEEDRLAGVHVEQPDNPQEEEDLVNIEIEETGEKVDPRKQQNGDVGTTPRKSEASSKKDKEDRKKEKKMREKERRTKVNEEKRVKASKD